MYGDNTTQFLGEGGTNGGGWVVATGSRTTKAGADPGPKVPLSKVFPLRLGVPQPPPFQNAEYEQDEVDGLHPIGDCTCVPTLLDTVTGPHALVYWFQM